MAANILTGAHLLLRVEASQAFKNKIDSKKGMHPHSSLVPKTRSCSAAHLFYAQHLQSILTELSVGVELGVAVKFK